MDLAFLKNRKIIILIIAAIIVIPSTIGIIFAINILFTPTFHPSIIIESNSDFIPYDFPGNGTEENPYIIKDLKISASVDLNDMNVGISIRNTDRFFIIKNCLVYSDFLGISLIEVAAGTSWIINNTCISKSGDGGGIILNQMTNSTIKGNLCINFMQGIHINHVTYCLIKSNIVESNNYQGINVRYSSHNLIINNTVKFSPQHGIAIVGNANLNKIYHNNLINNSFSETYDVDGRLTGTINSQGFDEGSDNNWYNDITKKGNYWSDYQGIGNYSIDGPAGTEDRYPFEIN
ncbi:MAG: NosD domain-containing protein [Promethearchaeota archaeon]